MLRVTKLKNPIWTDGDRIYDDDDDAPKMTMNKDFCPLEKESCEIICPDDYFQFDSKYEHTAAPSVSIQI